MCELAYLRVCSGSNFPTLHLGGYVAVMTLDPCPSSPNCVSTQADPSDSGHYIAPVAYTGQPSNVIAAITDAVSSNGGRVVSSTDTSVKAVFVTKLLKFKDDVDFELDDDAKLIHFRSASRVGHSDLGTNRKRMDALMPKILARLG